MILQYLFGMSIAAMEKCKKTEFSGWFFTAILGWTNSATIGSVVSYNVYWIVIILVFWSLIYEEKNGFLPLIPISWQLKRIQKENLYQP